LAEISTCFRGINADHISICWRMRSGSAAGKSTLLSTGTISWLLLMA
jgi:hypothetical protein